MDRVTNGPNATGIPVQIDDGELHLNKRQIPAFCLLFSLCTVQVKFIVLCKSSLLTMKCFGVAVKAFPVESPEAAAAKSSHLKISTL